MYLRTHPNTTQTQPATTHTRPTLEFKRRPPPLREWVWKTYKRRATSTVKTSPARTHTHFIHCSHKLPRSSSLIFSHQTQDIYILHSDSYNLPLQSIMASNQAFHILTYFTYPTNFHKLHFKWYKSLFQLQVHTHHPFPQSCLSPPTADVTSSLVYLEYDRRMWLGKDSRCLGEFLLEYKVDHDHVGFLSRVLRRCRLTWYLSTLLLSRSFTTLRRWRVIWYRRL